MKFVLILIQMTFATLVQAQTPYGLVNNANNFLTKINLNTMTIVGTITNPNNTDFSIMDAQDNGTGLAYATDTLGYLHEIDLQNDVVIRSSLIIECLFGSIGRCSKLAVSPNGQYIGLMNQDNARVLVFPITQLNNPFPNPTQDVQLNTFQGSQRNLLRWAPDNQTLIFSVGYYGDGLNPVQMYFLDRISGNLDQHNAVGFVGAHWAAHPRSISFFNGPGGTLIAHVDSRAKDPSMANARWVLGLNQYILGVPVANYYPYQMRTNDHWYDVSAEQNTGFTVIGADGEVAGYDPQTYTFFPHTPVNDAGPFVEVEWTSTRLFTANDKVIGVTDAFGYTQKVTLAAVSDMNHLQAIPGSNQNVTFSSYAGNLVYIYRLDCGGLACLNPSLSVVRLVNSQRSSSAKEYKTMSL